MDFWSYTFNIRHVARHFAGFNTVFARRKTGTDEVLEQRYLSNVDRDQTTPVVRAVAMGTDAKTRNWAATLFVPIQEISTQQQVV